jgi:hypothetical protein
MEATGGLGSIGTYDAKLSAGVASLSVGLNVDVAALLLAKAAVVTNAAEKAILEGAAALLKAMV